ncbi:uncharacterized protein LOC123533910 [Mercenaria mercenaria]|uniref:uncharacterized protein LOC123533910 n=1 Tax=Mercenaria mercenaria TaxID=6596 RepID=UPI00234EA1F5|nr:uncharacterized protein LOC123533910 [Mercenaria mercenaria]XP_053375049.1 uncharacterized protein LOC123533910 [Mercenaria mercenaria]
MTIVTENSTLSTSESSVEGNVPAGMRSYDFGEIQGQGTSGSSFNENIHKTETYVSEFTTNGGLLNVTTSGFDNSTEESNSEVDDIHSSFNLAIIPTVAAFLFIVIICIKCCKWFRQYARGGSKDDKFYAVIVTDDDKQYGHIDITSDTTSTACYDTVSSYTSFLKRSGNESTLSSIRTWHQDSIKSMSNTTSATANTKKSINGEIKPLASLSKTSTKVDETNGDFNVRISSTSSAETVSEQLTDSPAIRRNNRFRVSFVTETKPSASEYRTPNGSINHEKFIRSSLKKSPTATSYETASQSSKSERISKQAKMIDVGTQTNKSFRYSLRKSKAHASESEIDERLLSRHSTYSLALQSDEGQRKDSDSNIMSTNSDKNKLPHVNHSSASLEKDMKSLHSTVIPEILKYPFDTNVEVIQHCKQTKEPNEDLELDDDVFIEEMITDSTPQSYKKQHLNSSISSEPYNSAKEKSEEKLFQGFKVQPEICFCSHCMTKICRNTVETICDEGILQVSDINPVVQIMCENCKLVNMYKQNVSCKTENNTTDEFPIQTRSEFIEIHERPSSTISLESSGYAELSSSESYSSFS